MLLEYFNERADQRCGTCDYCRERNKLELNDMEVKYAEEKILLALEDHYLTPQEAAAAALPLPADKVLRVIQWMVDCESIVLNKEGRFERSKK